MTGEENTGIVTARRALLRTRVNTGTALDYLNLLEDESIDNDTRITLRYVPDKLVLLPAAFAEYLASFANFDDETLEGLAIAILDDINNEVVPRWVQIAAARKKPAQSDQRVLIEDRQPKWDNPALLARLERF